MNALIERPHATTPAVAPVVNGMRFHHLGLEIAPELPFETWEAAVTDVMAIEGSFRWWIGKLLNYGEATYGEKYAQAVELTGLSYDTIVDYCYVERNVDPSVRTEHLSWSHHKLLAGLEYTDQRRMARAAITHGWTVKDLRQAVRALTLHDSAQDAKNEAQGTQNGKKAQTPTRDAETALGASWDADADADDTAIEAEYSVGDGQVESWRADYLAPQADLVVPDHGGNVYISLHSAGLRHLPDALALLPDVTCYTSHAALMGLAPFGNVYADVDLADQPDAFRLLCAAFDAGDVSSFLFAWDGALTDAWEPWAYSAACLTPNGTLFYTGADVNGFARAFQSLGVIVIGWELAKAHRTVPVLGIDKVIN